MKLKVYLPILICLLISTPSCSIRDSLDGCEICNKQEVNLIFKYFADGKPNSEGKINNVINQYIRSSYLYIYDESGALVGTKLDANTDDISFGKTIHLDPGKYTIVAWGNAGQNSKIIEPEHLSSGRIEMDGRDENNNLTGGDQLYYGTTTFEIKETEEKESTSHEIIFESANIDFNVVILGLKENQNIEVEIKYLMPSYDFKDMSWTSPMLEKVKPPLREDFSGPDNVYRRIAKMKSYRFNDDNPILITLRDKTTGKALEGCEDIPLAHLMEKNGTTVENLQEATVVIIFEFKDTFIRVSVKGWEYFDVIPSN